jgi:thioredoxin-like negative regulator of GroEL
MSKRLLHLSMLVAVTVMVWGQSLGNGFVWDDRILIVKNEATISRISLSTALFSDFWSTETESGSSNYYRPLVTLSYMVDYALYGLRPAGYHVTNLVIHTVGVVSLWCLLLLLGVTSGTAALAAAVWAIHPAVCESVAWISGRTDSLATLFILLSVITGMNAALVKRHRDRWIAGSAALFAAALLSKESAIITPLLTAIFLVMIGKRGKIDRAFVWSACCVWIGWLALRLIVLAKAVGMESGEGIPLNLALLSLLHTWGTLVWPPVLRIEYGSALTSHALVVGATLGGLLLVWIGGVLATNYGPRPVRYLYLAALVAFIPSVMAVLLKSMIGARLVYTSAAFALAGVTIGCKLDTRGRMARGLFACAFVALALTTIQRARLWRSDTVLFTAALESADPSTRNHLNLGIALFDEGDLAGALDHLSRDMERSALDQKHYMLSLVYTAIDCESLAEGELLKSIDANPRFFSAYHNLAGLRAVQGRHEESRETLLTISRRDNATQRRALAQRDLLKSLEHLPRREPRNAPWCEDRKARDELFNSAVSLNRLAGEHLRRGKVELVEPLLRAVSRLDPWFVAGRLNLAQLSILKGDPRKAREILGSILATDPGEARAQRLLASLDGSRFPIATSPQPRHDYSIVEKSSETQP